MNIVIACGGSGGHIFPGIALARELASRGKNNKTLIVCSSKPLDITILKKSGLDFKALACNPFIFKNNPLGLSIFFARLIKGIFLCIRLLIKDRPDCVVGFGGFTSGPVIFSAWLLRIPRIIHEQNLSAGLANRIGALFADRVAVSFEETKSYFNGRKVFKTGNPVRGSFRFLDKAPSKERFGFDREKFTLFIMGGSQGADFVNKVASDALSLMDYNEKAGLQVIHLTGTRDYEWIKERYARNKIKNRVFSFLDEIDRAYTASDLAVARAGATTIAELAFFGVPSILIPYPDRRVRQRENALFFSKGAAGINIEQEDLDAEKLKALILGLAGNEARLDKMSLNSKRLGNPDAARLLADEVENLAGAD